MSGLSEGEEMVGGTVILKCSKKDFKTRRSDRNE